MEKTKTCTKCEETKPLAEFSRDRKSKDGLQYHCKECNRAYAQKNTAKIRDYKKRRHAESPEAARERARRYYAENTEKVKAYQREYNRANAEKVRARQSRYNRANRERFREQKRAYASQPHRVAWRRAYTAANAEANRRRARVWRDVNPERDRASSRNWYRRNKARAKLNAYRRRARLAQAEGSFDTSDIVRLWHRQRGECFYCSERLGQRPSDRAFEIDHMTPLSRGGSNWPRNLALTCQHCNRSKHARTPAEYRLYLLSRARG